MGSKRRKRRKSVKHTSSVGISTNKEASLSWFADEPVQLEVKTKDLNTDAITSMRVNTNANTIVNINKSTAVDVSTSGNSNINTNENANIISNINTTTPNMNKNASGSAATPNMNKNANINTATPNMSKSVNGKAATPNTNKGANENTTPRTNENNNQNNSSLWKDLFYVRDLSTKRAFLEFLPLGIFSFIIYLLTVCQTVPGGDSGELITVSYRLGVAHPPGYPLYTLMAHLVSYFPFGSVAARVNFLSALFQMGAGWMMFLLFRRWMRNVFVAWLVVGIFSFSPLVWRYSVVAEVFTLNNLFLISLTYVVFRFYEEPSKKWALWFAGLLGLACSHHHTILFFAVPFFATVTYFYRRVIFQGQVFFPALGLWVLGLFPYLFIPWASAKEYIFSWGAGHTWEGFKTHFLRREYGTFQLASGQQDYDNFLFSLGKYSLDTLDQFLIIGIIPALFALILAVRNWKSQSHFVKTIVVSTVFYLLVFHVLANMDLSNRLFYDVQSRFWMAPNIMLSLLMGAGILYCLRKVQESWSQLALSQIVGTCVVAIIALQVSLHYQIENYSKNRVFEQVGRSMLKSLPENSLLLMRGDIYVNAVRYLQDVEGYRKDIRAIPFDLLWWPWMENNVKTSMPDVRIPGDVYRYQKRRYGHFTLKDLIDANIDRFPIYTGKLRSDEMENISSSYKLWNIGYLNKILPKDESLNFENYISDARGFEEFIPPTKEEIRETSWEAFVYYNYWDREFDRARQIFEEALRVGKDLKMIAYGKEIMKKVIAYHPQPPAVMYKNLGVAYQYLGQKHPKYNPQMIKAWKQYLEKASNEDPDINKIRMIIATYENKVKEIRRETSSVKKVKEVGREISSVDKVKEVGSEKSSVDKVKEMGRETSSAKKPVAQ